MMTHDEIEIAHAALLLIAAMEVNNRGYPEKHTTAEIQRRVESHLKFLKKMGFAAQ